MRSVTIILLVLFAVLQYRLWFGSGSLPDVKQLETTRDTIANENEKLIARNQTLAAEVMDLKHGKESVEERARSEMGMIKQTETFYQIVTESGKQSEYSPPE